MVDQHLSRACPCAVVVGEPFWQRCETSDEPSELRVLAEVGHGEHGVALGAGMGTALGAAWDCMSDNQVVEHSVLHHTEAVASLDIESMDQEGAGGHEAGP